MAECWKCQQKIHKGEWFTLIGEYPSGGKRYWDWLWGKTVYGGLGHYGKLFCKECFLKEFTPRPDAENSKAPT